MKYLIYSDSLTQNRIHRARGFIKFNTACHGIELKIPFHGGKLRKQAKRFYKDLRILISKYYYLREDSDRSSVATGGGKTRSIPIYLKYRTREKFETYNRKDLQNIKREVKKHE